MIETRETGGAPAANRNRHFPGFDGLRLAAALSVIFSHGFLITTGSETAEPFVRLLGSGNIIGLYGVFTFFIISGFLLGRSLSIKPDMLQFTVNRVLRIYPGFAFCILVTALVLGPLASSFGAGAYFASADTLGYITVALTCLCDVAQLPGVYNYQGEVASVVNGSLWSLSYEVLSYLFLVCAWVTFRSHTRVALVIAIAAIATAAFPIASKSVAGIAYTLPYFAAGIVMSAAYERYGTSNTIAILCLAGLVAAAFVGVQHLAFAVFGAYVIVHLAQRPNIGSRFAERFGDLSYGVYLFGWPVQQIVKQFTATTSTAYLLLVTVPLVFALAALSCHLVERPALALKDRARSGIAWLLMPFTVDAARRRVFHAGATLCTAMVVPVLLTSSKQWWYVSENLLGVALAAVCAGALAVACASMTRAYKS